MDFRLTDEQRQYVELAQQFAADVLAPNAAKWDAEHEFPKAAITQAGELGFCALYSPEDAGGLGLSRLDSALIFEALAQGCTTTTAMITIHNMATWMLTTWGTAAIKQRWAAGLTSGELLASYCLTEPNAGSDAAALTTSAKLDGDSYLINGSKVFISGAGATDVLVVMARTGEAGPKGISALVVPADAAGVSYGKAEDKMGWNAQPTREVTFTNVRVSREALLGDGGDGFCMAMKGLDGGRINIAACSLGTAQAALQHAVDYMHEREQFGKPLSTFQALQFKVADMLTELTAARQMVYLAASYLDNGHPQATTYCAMAKRFATDIGFKVCDAALQLHGGYGYIREYPLERYFRDTRVHQILEGTNEIMRLIIGRNLLSQGLSGFAPAAH
ncbi:acyl-CoA dehydrogenase family protein [Shewanella sp. C32]|uniref:Acyl-CoA dehydrogenase family protein n=1 Tax=Shewanella electrica TaxID=515560 RepID=A0ABT2FIG8_9GAMM|nr:acyl-CoA dehydrogenase family protein [Shewanella electrica]MCH1923353.1 acyl-CoA dehydrogenase family protein [Shewanella electrica]MCS4555450.1 acyl-CoA dehydrogenase family protein [Shewanella electrica]